MSKYENYGLLIDYKYCTNCHSCEVACQQEKGLGVNEFGIKVFESKPERKGSAVDDAWDWTYLPMPTWRCDLCADRMDAGRKPMCVKHCLAACMQVGPVEELAEKAKGLGDKVVIFKPIGSASIDLGTVGLDELMGDSYDNEKYRGETSVEFAGGVETDWENREFREVLKPEEVSLDAFIGLSVEDRLEFLQGQVASGKTPDEVVAMLGLDHAGLAFYECVFVGREARMIPKRNTI